MDKIIIPEAKRNIDLDVVHGIVESAKIIGLIHPIAVRKVQLDGQAKVRTVLVAGTNQLQAAKQLGWERIDCKFIDRDDDEFAELVAIAENLFRKHLSVLRKSDLIMRWYELAIKNRISGQDGQKRTRGRPPGGDSEIARTLPFAFDSFHAQRKILQRAKSIAQITPEAKQAAIDAGLDDDQTALLAIAKASSKTAQLKKVASLAKDAGNAAEEPGAEGTSESVAEVYAEDKTDLEEPKKRRRNKSEASHPDTTFEQIQSLWNEHCRRAWKYLPKPERDRFIEMLSRARCKAHRDVHTFVTDVFMGRQNVYAADLYALAKKRGLPKKAVRMIVKYQHHRLKRTRQGRSGPVYYRNSNNDWKNELPKISESELKGQKLPERADDDYDLHGPSSDPTATKVSKQEDDYYRL
ncbi:MAG: ParB/RepB/Spo0J family partition protein [Xanthobacteraceae bacterium]